jgi:hypothetical protein
VLAHRSPKVALGIRSLASTPGGFILQQPLWQEANMVVCAVRIMGRFMILLAAALALTQLPPYRWVYLQTNFFVENNVNQAIALTQRAAKAGYNGIVIADSKLQNQDPFPDFYVKNMQRFLAAARESNVEVYPAVLPVGYADGMLFRNPQLVESMPCRHVAFTVRDGRLTQDTSERYSNGSLAQWRGDRVEGCEFQDGAGVTSFRDDTNQYDGMPSLRMQDPGNLKDTSGNCRLVKRVNLEPWRQYRLTFYLKTRDFVSAGSVNAAILDPNGGRSIPTQSLSVKPTQDWTKQTLVFNSENLTSVLIYIGVWNGAMGELWLADISLRDAGFLNVNRRPTCAFALTDAAGHPLSEGSDVETVSDPHFGNIPGPGSFDMTHDIPQPEVLGNRLKEGDTVYADYFVAATVMDNQPAICLSDPATPIMEQREIEKIEGLMHPPGFFLSQDEMRTIGWDTPCERSGKTPGQLVAADIKRSIGFLYGKKAFVWSDMFDPFHNAVANYYLANGSLEGSWLGLRPGTVIVNWNSGKQDESLRFFASHGFGQILAGYYDGPVDNIKPWIGKAKQTGSYLGVMYTTWVGNYNDLEAFAKAAFR